MAIKSILELAKYNTDNPPYWITLVSTLKNSEIMMDNEDEWMLHHHPKILYDRKKTHWPYKTKLPKLYCCDFHCITILLTSKLAVQEFKIEETHRSSGTGEFYYRNDAAEWMPESYLFDSEAAAKRERDRILNMIKNWAT